MVGCRWRGKSPSHARGLQGAANLFDRVQRRRGDGIQSAAGLVDVRHTCIEPGNYSQGDGSPPSVLAAKVKTMLGEWDWPPGRAPRESVAEYWHLVIRKHLDHRPELVTKVDYLEDSVQLALDVSAANPMLKF